jgi:putative DNA primase/helicase
MTIAELLARFSDVEETPDGWLVPCPAHDDSHNSLRLSVSEAGKVLLRDRAGCPTEKVLDKLGLTMRDLATMTPGGVDLSKRAVSQDVPADPGAVAALAVKLDRYADAIHDDGSAEFPGVAALNYAADRFGITLDDVNRLGLGYAEDLGGGPRLVVPFRDRDGVARGFQARALDPEAQIRWLGPKSPDGASWTKLGYFPGLGGYDEILIAEGPGDALTGSAAGFDTIGIRGAGLSANPTVVEGLVELIGGRPVVVAGDGDAAGRRFTQTLAEALHARGLSVKVLPMRDGKDLTDWRADGPARFHDDLLYHVAKAKQVETRATLLGELAWDEDRYALSDLGGARYLRDYIESIGSGVKYTEEAGFFLLEDGVWRPDAKQGVRTHAQAVADLVRKFAKTASIAVAGASDEDAVAVRDKKRAARLNRYAAHVQTSRGIDSLLRELQAVHGVPASIEDFDRHPDLLAALNGVINLRTGELLPHDPGLLLTRRIDLDYNPDAPAPRWEEFLREVFPSHPELPAYMQRLTGYGLTGHTTEQCFVVHWGTGANGKSVYTDTTTEVFREITVTTGFSTFEDRASGGIPNDLAALKGARLVMASEGEQGRPMAEAVLKRVTGRDLISARFMRKEFFEFRPTFLLMLATNFKPSFKGQDEGLWRRVKLIPWERYFKPDERDHRLGEKLLAEREGILAWAVRGSVEWYRRGLDDPEVIRSATKEYRETSDALAGFLPGVFVKDETSGRVDGQALFDAYLEWADAENLPPRERWTRRTFYSAMEERGLPKRKVAKGIAFDGIRRARQTDRVPDHDQPERADEARSATFSSEPPSNTPSLSGADLDSII